LMKVDDAEIKSGKDHRPEKDFDDAEVIERILSGEINDFAILVRKYQKGIYNYALRMLGHEEEARDLAQDIFVAAFKGLKGFRGESKFSTWLFRIAINQTKNRIKYLRRRHFFDDEQITSEARETPDMFATLSGSEDNPEEAFLKKDFNSLIMRGLMELPPEARQIIILRDIEDFTYEELSQIMELNLGTVKSRLHRARHALRKLVETKVSQGKK